MKAKLCIFFAVTTVALSFFGCAAKLPDEPITTSVEEQTFISPMAQTVPAPENSQTNPDGSNVTYPVEFVDVVNNIEIVHSSYYVYNNSVAKITNVSIEDDGFSNKANAYADVEMISVGRRKDGMKIGYTAYDKDGKLVRESFIYAPLDGIKTGEVITERRLDFPRDAVKIVFHDYIEQ